MFYVDRYDFLKKKRLFSGYECLPKYILHYKQIKNTLFLNKVLKYLLFKKKPKNYLFVNSSKEIKAIIIAFFTQRPVHFLYADKDAWLILLFKKYFPFFKLSLFGTFHWPISIHDDYHLSLFKYFDKVVVMGSKFKFDVDKYCKDVRCIPHGIDLEFWQRSSDYSKSGLESSRILIIGNSNRDHARQLFILNVLVSMNLGLSFFLICGNNEYLSDYLKIPNLRYAKGFISDMELKTMYHDSKAVLLMQYDSIASNVVLESMAMGIPLITSDIGDVGYYLGREYPFIQDNINLNKQLIDFLTDDNLNFLSQDLITKSKHFTWSKIAEQTNNYFEF